MSYFCDTHCHLYLDEFQQDINGVIHQANLDRINKILVPGINYETSLQAVDLSRQYAGILFPAVGIHPNDANKASSEDIQRLRQMLKDHAEIKAIGEIGLDFYRTWAAPADQELILKEMLKLAKDFNKPICLHVRQAGEEILNFLEPWFADLISSNHPLVTKPGVFHAFDGSPEISQWALEHNFMLGIGGPLTYKKNQPMRDAVAQIGLDALILETDSPYLTPLPYRGKRNQPAYIKYIAGRLAEILNEDLAKVADVTSRNAAKLFGWDND